MSAATAAAGLYAPGVSPANLPWPGGVVPYVFDAGVPPAKQAVYLAGLKEYELAAKVQFVPRIAETQYVVFKFDPLGPNRVSGSQPVTVEVNSLTRGQICHEMGHALGLEHEHQRPDRDAYVQVLSANIVPGNDAAFSIASGATMHGSYDFESVMHYGRDTLSIQAGVLDTLQAKAGYEKYQQRMGNVALSPGDRALMAFLYGPPVVAPSPVVTTTADSGPGSLRAAIYYATDHPATPVSFNIPSSDPGYAAGIWTIRPRAWLPPLVQDGLKIDASTQPGATPGPRIKIEATELAAEEGNNVPGLYFLAGGCEVKGLAIASFPWCGMAMSAADASGNRVIDCTSTLNAFQGLQIADGAQDNLIEGCVFSGNQQYGLWISQGHGNAVRNCRIGTNPEGSAAQANGFGGMILTGATHENLVEANLISGNVNAGLWITGAGVDHNTIRANRIGISENGRTAIPNTFVGAYVIDGASDNLIEANRFHGNIAEGLRLAGTGTSDNRVKSNFADQNGFGGITLFGGATNNLIEANILSSNGTVGLAIGDPGTSGNRARRNLIGSDISGSVPEGNGFAGIYLVDGCSGNWIGDGPGTGNLISDNGGCGVYVKGSGPAGNAIWNNLIGPALNGAPNFGSQLYGIQIQAGAGGTRVGGSEPGAANVIRGNTARGIALFEAGAQGNTFSRNSITNGNGNGIALNDGSNHAIAAPVLDSATRGTAIVVTGSFTGLADTVYRIEYFVSPASGQQGESFLGDRMVTTDGNGSATVNATLPGGGSAERYLNATATAVSTGDTSGFSNAVLISRTDSDADGMTDAYEDAVLGLNKNIAADAALDFDGDGMSNRDEFLAGTDPLNAASRMQMTANRSGGFVTLTFPSITGTVYFIDAATSLAGPWRAAAVNLSGDGGTMQLQVPVSSPRGFFRLLTGP